MTTNTQTYLQEVKERLNEATPGPWKYDCGNGEIESRNNEHFRIVVAYRSELTDRKNHCEHFQLKYCPPDIPRDPHDDMEFIAHAPTDLAKLVEAVEKAMQTIDNIAEKIPSQVSVNEAADMACEFNMAAVKVRYEIERIFSK